MKCIEDEIPFEVPKGWGWERLSNLASFSGGKTPSKSNREYWEGDIIWVTSKDMKSKYIDSSLLMMSEKGLEQMQLYPENTLLLVTRSGILRHTIPVAILKKPATINQDLKAIMPYIPNLEEYIYICIKGMESRLILEYTKAGATVENINFDAFQKILLPIPPENQIQRIIIATNEAEEVIGKLKINQEDLIDIIGEAKSKILDLAIRGKLVPQDPNDEPASILLEHIRAEKEELIKQGKIKRDKKESVIFKGEDNSYYEKIGNKYVCIDSEVPFDLPFGWIWCRGYSCFSGMETRHPDGKYFKYIDIDSIDNKVHKIKCPKVIATKDAPSRANRCVKTGSVLFSFVRPYLKNIAYVDEKNKDCIASTGFYVCNSNGVLYPSFMYYLMISEYVVQGLNQFMKGDNSPSISKDNIENWLYPIPPHNEQKRICSKLEELIKLTLTVEKSLS